VLRVVWLVSLGFAASIAGCHSRADFPTAAIGSDCLQLPIVSPASATVHVGDTLRVSVSTRICPGQPSPTLAPYAWTSSDSSVARVDAASGLLLGLRSGAVTIIAYSVAVPSVKAAMALQIAP